ncbi:MAG: futalosine hydrolase [Planctomycetia bacterium]|nr:futalosine hydrolase [Planctomycetia bacterium]
MAPHLILVPTALERDGLAPLVGSWPRADLRVELCGFGIAAAAARTAQLVATHRPRQVTLVGIAGRLADDLDVGAAAVFAAVACHGIGAGSGARFIPAQPLGWPQWPGDPPDPGSAIGDLLPLALPPADTLPDSVARAPLLLTVAAAAGDDDDVRLRRTLFPTAVAEDMEGFAVALACRLAAVPCTIIRGISNTAGDRDTRGWRIPAALAAAAAILRPLLERAP